MTSDVTKNVNKYNLRNNYTLIKILNKLIKTISNSV